MSDIKQAIEINARMYEMQETAKQILGDSYGVKVAYWMDLIEKVSKNLECGRMQAVLYMADPGAGHGEALTDCDVIMLSAALVELAEAERGGKQ